MCASGALKLQNVIDKNKTRLTTFQYPTIVLKYARAHPHVYADVPCVSRRELANNYCTEHIINFSPLAGRLMCPCTVNESPVMQAST